jgi:23S rRNA (cytosine1962-C5)-methyltransferase
VGSFERRIAAAFDVRARLFEGDDTDAYRLVNGEGDRVPGLVIDRYRDVAVLRLDGASLDSWIDALREPLRAALGKIGVRSAGLRIARDARAAGKPWIDHLWGPPIPERTVVHERGLALEVDLHFGHKTGAFLDHRENLARVRSLARGRGRALNLFSYTGGFSIAAALGGAAHVTSVDTAGPAHASAQRSFRANGIDPSAHTFVTARRVRLPGSSGEARRSLRSRDLGSAVVRAEREGPAARDGLLPAAARRVREGARARRRCSSRPRAPAT